MGMMGQKEETMNFSDALDAVKAGKRICRAGWSGRDMHIEMQVPDVHSKMRRPYLFIKPVDGMLVPWTVTQTDVMADDWDFHKMSASAVETEKSAA
jgi:hypothetical protein